MALSGVRCITPHEEKSQPLDDHIVAFLTRGSTLLADFLVVGVTVMKTFRQWRTARQFKLEMNLTSSLLRHGKCIDAGQYIPYSLCPSRSYIFYVRAITGHFIQYS